MFQKDKLKEANPERRKHKRSDYEAMISHEILTDDTIHTGKMLNISQGGLYFESDQTIFKGDEILIKVTMLSDEPDCYEQFPVEIEIIWQRDLNNSAYKYGYGGKYILENEFISRETYSPDLESRGWADSRLEDRNDPRRHPRRLLNQSLLIKYRDQIHKGFIRNISLGGAFIETGGDFLLGTEIDLVISQGNPKKNSKLKGKVVRFSPKGFAVSFAKPPRSNRDEVDRNTARAPDRDNRNARTPGLSSTRPFEF